VRAILPHLPLAGSILEPCAGDGTIVRALVAAGCDPDRISAIELDRAHEPAWRQTTVSCLWGNALGDSADPLGAAAAWNAPHALVIMNPPFVNALEFVQRALHAQAPHRGTTAALLRLGMMAGVARAEFWSRHPADVYVLGRRPSFTGGGSDASEYAWFVWAPGRGGRWSVLPGGPDPRRARTKGGAS
jgi:predicted RNA methylase